MLYTIKKDVVHGGHYIKNVKTGKIVFYGTKAECDDWLEVNGHDEWN